MGGIVFSSVSAAPSQATARATGLAKIRQRGRLIVAVKDNLRPLGFRNAAGELVGLEIDLAHQLAVDLLGDPSKIELRPVANAERLPALINGTVDLVIARLTVNRSRSRQVDFSPPYYLDGTALITRDPRVQSLRGLQRRAIAVLANSSTVAVVQSRFPQASVVAVPSYQAAKELLETSQAVVAFAADASVLTGWVQEFPAYRLLPGLVSTEALAIAMPRGLQFQELRQQVDRLVRRWQVQGWLASRIQAWGLPQSVQ
ncbi:MAG TPA: transporter substrate-binding domain-containing protein [Synechococcales cyanobacterium M55_K2018_004]|nr:transporter substrate-binding domain-containing protein [Synechococcales cyanobacterium M55_K2018_004]